MSANEIIPGLWLGSRPVGSRFRELKTRNIHTILTIEQFPLTDVEFRSFRQKFICALDLPNENILEHFEEAFKFIEENIENGILVHW